MLCSWYCICLHLPPEHWTPTYSLKIDGWKNLYKVVPLSVYICSLFSWIIYLRWLFYGFYHGIHHYFSPPIWENMFWTFLQSSKSRKSKFFWANLSFFWGWCTILRMNISPEGPGTFEDDDDFANFPRWELLVPWSPRDPITHRTWEWFSWNEKNTFPRRWLYTPIIIWQGDWILRGMIFPYHVEL